MSLAGHGDGVGNNEGGWCAIYPYNTRQLMRGHHWPRITPKYTWKNSSKFSFQKYLASKSSFTRQTSASVERGFGGLPLHTDAAPPSDQNLPPSWLDNERHPDIPGNFGQKCLNAKNKITSFFSGRPKLKKENTEFSDSENHGNTNFGFKYSESWIQIDNWTFL